MTNKIKNVLGEPLGEYRKIETLKRLNIYISAYQAIIRSYMKLTYRILKNINNEHQILSVFTVSILWYLPRGFPNKYEQYHLQRTPDSYNLKI